MLTVTLRSSIRTLAAGKISGSNSEIYYGRNGIRLSRALLSGSEVCGGGAPGTHLSSSINLRGPAVGKAISRTASRLGRRQDGNHGKGTNGQVYAKRCGETVPCLDRKQTVAGGQP